MRPHGTTRYKFSPNRLTRGGPQRTQTAAQPSSRTPRPQPSAPSACRILWASLGQEEVPPAANLPVPHPAGSTLTSGGSPDNPCISSSAFHQHPGLTTTGLLEGRLCGRLCGQTLHPLPVAQGVRTEYLRGARNWAGLGGQDERARGSLAALSCPSAWGIARASQPPPVSPMHLKSELSLKPKVRTGCFPVHSPPMPQPSDGHSSCWSRSQRPHSGLDHLPLHGRSELISFSLYRHST